jgi:hypothetical protein
MKESHLATEISNTSSDDFMARARQLHPLQLIHLVALTAPNTPVESLIEAVVAMGQQRSVTDDEVRAWLNKPLVESLGLCELLTSSKVKIQPPTPENA